MIWGGGWDVLFERDTKGILQARMEQAVDGDYQFYTVSPGDVVREHWVEDFPELRELMDSLNDEEIRTIKRGGHDRHKVYAAFQQATEVTGKPCVVLLKTVKGDGLGPKSEGRNTVHQKKHLSSDERRELAGRLGIPLSDEAIVAAEFYRPPDDSEEIGYLKARREALGGPLPAREVRCERLEAPPLEFFSDMLRGSGKREVSTTMAVVRMLQKLLRYDGLGRYVVPIVPTTRRARSAWTGSSRRRGSSPSKASATSRWTPGRSRRTAKRRTGRSCRKASARPARWRRSSRPARRTPTTACP